MRLLLAMTLLLSALAAGGCHPAKKPQTPVDAEVIVRAASGREVHVKVEVARSAPDRERGLMYRQKLEGGAGMIFLFERPQPLKFWMHNTYIPLDMIFIDEHKRIVFVEENAEPLTDTSRGPEALTQFVLEVPGGWSRAQGIEAGGEVRFVGID